MMAICIGSFLQLTCSPCSPCATRSGYITSNIEAAGGQSGSAIWDNKNYVRAIHVTSGPGHRTINKQVFDLIQGYAV